MSASEQNIAWQGPDSGPVGRLLLFSHFFVAQPTPYAPFTFRDFWCNCAYETFPATPQAAVALAFEEMRTPHASGREICAQKFGNAYQRNRETNGAFQKHLYHHRTIQRNTEMLFSNDARFPFTTLACLPWSFASCSLRRAETLFAYAVRIASMILRTARFLCVLYAEICVNATAAQGCSFVEYRDKILTYGRSMNWKKKCLEIIYAHVHSNRRAMLCGQVSVRGRVRHVTYGKYVKFACLNGTLRRRHH